MLDLGIAIVVRGETEKEACRLRTLIQSSARVSEDYSAGNVPHLTLFQNRFPSHRFEAICQVVQEIASEQAAFPISLCSTLYLRKPSNYVFWNVERSEPLMKLHERCVASLNGLREGLLLPRYQKRLNSEGTSEADKALIQAFGILLVGDHWLPHITLAKLQSEEPLSAIEHIKPQAGLPMQVESIAVGRIGFWGDVEEILQEARLRPNVPG